VGVADESGEITVERARILERRDGRTVPRRAARSYGSTVSTDCLFCRIVRGEVPSTEVLATARSYAFRDLNPMAPTHVLVIPRLHITNADTVAAEHADDVADLLVTAQAVARAEGLVREGVDPADDGGYRLVFNVGEDAMNSVPHLHLHVIGGRPMTWPPG